MPTDLVIAGGGPAGLAAAIHARLHGLSVKVIERRRPPLDKPCGEGLMPLGVAELDAMGVRIDPGHCAPFAGIRFLDEGGVAEGRFPDRHGLGIRRTLLSEALLRRAEELGAELCFGRRVESWRPLSDRRVHVCCDGGDIEAGLLIAADGLHSRLRRAAGLALRPRGRVRHGMRRHFRLRPEAPFVEVHWAEGIEAYVTPVAPDEVGVALLWSGPGGRYEAMLERLPRLARRLAGAQPTSPCQGAARLRQRVGRRLTPGLALLGDAAGYVDALTGEGLSLAFRCARALVEGVARGDPLAEYERAYRALARSTEQMASLMLAVSARPWLRRRVVRMLARHPELFDRALAINATHAPLHEIGLGGALRLVGGLVA